MNPSDEALWKGAAPTWLSQTLAEGNVSNPAVDSTICDTGQLAAGVYDVFYMMGASAACGYGQCSFKWKNAANTSTFIEHFLYSAGADQLSNVWKGIKIAANERFTVASALGFVGTLSGSIIAVRRA